MEDYIVSARKYRPAEFTAVLGQEHIVTTLENAIATQQLAQALLFAVRVGSERQPVLGL